MGLDRVTVALDRMDQALARIESAAQARDSSLLSENAELNHLRTVHQNLRGRVETAIAQIDRLLEKAGPD
ncbi:MAG TPA: hypothetical protein VGB62_10305 [Allosphingosinicella sp.]|jgi:RPA family protein